MARSLDGLNEAMAGFWSTAEHNAEFEPLNEYMARRVFEMTPDELADLNGELTLESELTLEGR